MITIFSFFTVIYILLGIITGILLYSLYSIKGVVLRTILLVLGIIIIPSSYILMTQVLGNPRPIEFNFVLSEEKYILKDFFLVEKEAIYLWLLDKESNRPIYISLPWKMPEAQKIVDLTKIAGPEGHVEVDLKFDPSNQNSLFNPGILVEYEVVLPPPPPPKQVNQNIQVVE